MDGGPCACGSRGLTQSASGSRTGPAKPIGTPGRVARRCVASQERPEFTHSYNEACARKIAPPTGKLLHVLQQYQASDGFLCLADETRRGYVKLIVRIEHEFADFPLAALTDKRTRGIFAPSSRLCLDGSRSRLVLGPRSRARRRKSMCPRWQALSRLTRGQGLDR
jgi:hypothetical protein